MSIPRLLKSDTFLVNQTGPRPRDATKFLGSTFTQRVVKNLPTAVLRVYVPPTPPAPIPNLTSYITFLSFPGPTFSCIAPNHTIEFYNEGPVIAKGVTQNDCNLEKTTIVFSNLPEPVNWNPGSTCTDLKVGLTFFNQNGGVATSLGNSNSTITIGYNI